MAISNTSRTLAYIREQGFVADKVEQFNPHAGKHGQRKDMFGFADIVAMGEGKIVAVQSCGGSGFQEHHRKLTEDEYVAPHVHTWLSSKGYLWLIAWRKIKMKRGSKALRWAPRIRKYYVNVDNEIKWTDIN